MKKTIKHISLFLSLLFIYIIVVFSISKYSFAYENTTIAYNSDTAIESDYSDEYKAWLKLSEEEREGCLAPNMYDDAEAVSIETDNPFKYAKMGGVSLESKFSLKNIIPENLVYKNQGSTKVCWTFAAMRVLETTLALNDYYNSNETKVYDYSERHLDYATGRNFIDGTNYKGFYRKIGTGGYDNMVYAYFTNGQGAIPESEMPFKYNINEIYLSVLKNKTISTRVYDIERFSYSKLNDSGMIAIKNHIKNYGGVETGNYFTNEAINFNTCAVYSTSGYMNHAVTIIGWDDNYSKNKFLSWKKPSKNGAWIAINTYGSSCKYLYISYYDAAVNDALYGFSKVTTDVNYDNIYQYDYYGPTKQYYVDQSKLYLGNIFKRTTDDIEYLTDVAIHAADTYTVKVYVNPNGTTMDKSNLQLVKLKAGDSETFGHGYHTLEFLEPIKLDGDNFAVVLEIESSGRTYFYTEKDNSYYDYDNYVEDSGKSYYSTKDIFSDSSKWKKQGSDNTIKAFTVSGADSLTIKANPTKTNYIEGEDFDEKGMVIVAKYSNGKTKTITDYTITDGTNLRKDQTSVTITYRNASIKLPITVEENSVTNIEITTPPTKTEYVEGENFDDEGMVVTASYKNGKQSKIADYKVLDGNNLKSTQTYVTISYEGKLINQKITVEKSELEKIVVTTSSTKTEYVEGEDFDDKGMVVTAIYKNGKQSKIADYKVLDGNNLKSTQTYVTISYEGKTTTQKIIVKQSELEKIEITTPATKIEYIEGEDFDDKGMVVTATYKNGKELKVTDYKILDGENLKSTQTYVTISYEGKTATQNIIVKKIEQEAIELEKIVVTTAPTKKVYLIGEDFDDEGMVITAIYKNGQEKEITNYTILNGKNLKLNQSSVTIKYNNKTITQDITVVNKSVKSISVKQMPNKTKYIQNTEDLDLSGGIIEVLYNDNTSSEMFMTSSEVKATGFNNEKLGKITITLSHNNKTTTMQLEIVTMYIPKSSSYIYAKSDVNKIVAYNFTDSPKESYILMDFEINNIERYISNDSFEYYYYLSPNQEERNIQEWIKIDEEQINDNKLSWTIDTSIISNYNEISNSNTLYLYLKEVVTKDGEKEDIIFKTLVKKSNVDAEIYLDGKLQTQNKESKKNNIIVYIIVAAIGILSVVGVYLYKKLRKNNWLNNYKYKKL